MFEDEEDEDLAEGVEGEIDCPDSVFKVALLFTNFWQSHLSTPIEQPRRGRRGLTPISLRLRRVLAWDARGGHPVQLGH